MFNHIIFAQNKGEIRCVLILKRKLVIQLAIAHILPWCKLSQCFWGKLSHVIITVNICNAITKATNGHMGLKHQGSQLICVRAVTPIRLCSLCQ